MPQHSAIWKQRQALGLPHAAHSHLARAPLANQTVYPPGYTYAAAPSLYDNGTGPLQDGGKHVSSATLAARSNQTLVRNVAYYGAIAAIVIGLIFVTRRFHLLTGGKGKHPGHAGGH